MTLDEILATYRDSINTTAEAPQFQAMPEGGTLQLPDRIPATASNFLTSLGGIGDALRANNNLITSAVDWLSLTHQLNQLPADENFNVFRDYDMKGLEKFAYQFGWAKSKAQADIIKQQLIEDMAIRRSFSDLGFWGQMLIGLPASLGPADFIPLGWMPKGILAAGATMTGLSGVQAALRQSMSLGGDQIGSVGVDAAMGGLFASGFRTFQRVTGWHGEELSKWVGLSDEADAPVPPPIRPAPVTHPVDPVVDAPTVRDPMASPRIIPDGEGVVEMPPVTSHPLPFVIDEAGPTSPMSTDHRAQTVKDSATGYEVRPLVLYEPVLTDGKQAYDLIGSPWIMEDGVLGRPTVLSATDRSGAAMARQAPSPHEIVAGQIGPEPFTARGVRLSEGPPSVPAAAADDAAERVRQGRPVIIEDDSSVGAQQARSNLWTDEDSRLANAGGLERLGLTPAMRGLNSLIAAVRDTVSALVNHGMLQVGNLAGKASELSVESRYGALHAPRIHTVVHGFWEDFAEFSGARALTGSRTLDFAAARVMNAGRGTSYKEFMRQVSMAVLDGGRSPNAAVQKAAGRLMNTMEDLRTEANKVGYWDFLYDLRQQEIEARLAHAAESGGQERIRRLQAELDEVKAERLAAQQNGGPVAKDDAGYLPRYYRHDKIMAERSQVEAIFDAVIRQKNIRDPLTGRAYTGKEAVDILLNIDEATGKPRPYVKPSGDAWAHSAKDRGFSWMPTKLLADYIETDAEVLLRRYVRQMGIDIELTARFGDPFMMHEIYRLAGAGASPLELEDVMFMRDYLRGTHMPMDPTSILTHSTQAAKMVANAVVLGSQVITALTDLGRPLMTEGFRRTFGSTFDALSDGLGTIKLWRKEAELLGSTGELVQSLRAQATANGNSAMAGTPGWLQTLERAHSGFFIANGIAPWTEVMKTWQTLITASRVMDDVQALAAGEKLSAKQLTKLAAIGLDERNALNIADMIARHQVVTGRTRLPNVAAWDDLEAARTFRSAIWQATNNSIITPGAANVSRWMVEGTSWLPPQAAQLIAMYHNYGLAMHQRLVVAGIQGADANFLGGALALLGLGYVVDHIRDELNTVGERRPRQKTEGERLASALDRSGLLGYATNVNNAIERLSFNTVGVRPFTGQVNWGNGSVVGALGGLGPVGSIAGNLYRAVNGAAHDRRGWAEAQAWRRMLPLQNLFYIDGLFDKIQDAIYVSPQEKRSALREQREAARQKATADRDEKRAGQVLVEQGYISNPGEVVDIEGYIGRAALAWDRGGRRGSLPDFIANFEG